MSERLELVELAMVPGANLSLLARRFGVSRQTVHKWCKRFRAEGSGGLSERSRRPGATPGRVAEGVEATVVALRAKHPAWGGRKLAARLRATGALGAGVAVPSPSTVTEILRRQGLLDPAESAARRAPIRFEHPAPNDLWEGGLALLRRWTSRGTWRWRAARGATR